MNIVMNIVSSSVDSFVMFSKIYYFLKKIWFWLWKQTPLPVMCVTFYIGTLCIRAHPQSGISAAFSLLLMVTYDPPPINSFPANANIFIFFSFYFLVLMNVWFILVCLIPLFNKIPFFFGETTFFLLTRRALGLY